MLGALKRFNYAFAHRVLRAWTKPDVNGVDRLLRIVNETSAQEAAGGEGASDVPLVYVLANRSLNDIVLLDIVAERHGLPSPFAALRSFEESRRFFFLHRPAGFTRRNTMRAVSARMRRLQALLIADPDATLALLPVSIFWGRAANKDRSLMRAFFSEGWAASSRLRRFLILLFNRRDILVQFGEPLAWHEIVRAGPSRPGPQPAADGPMLENDAELQGQLATRRTARLLRVKFRNQKVAALGPDLSHRRTLVGQILRSSQVRAEVQARVAAGAGARSTERSAQRAAKTIAADMSYPTIRFLDRLLSWFWHRIYDGIQVHGIDRVASLAETCTLAYVPCHRSYIDFLVLSYVLHHRGLMIPHIASGDNLNMPVVGKLLRRGGAFFMRRNFSGDALYSAVFSEYLYQVFRRGHSVEYFIEGTRSRSGLLLPAHTGMLQMTIAAHRRGVPRPIVFVPVYFGYEKLVEGGSYVGELRGEAKEKETVRGMFRSLRLVRQSFGSVALSFGQPIPLAAFLQSEGEADAGVVAHRLGDRILAGINACAHVNAVNLVSLATLAMPRLAIEQQALETQIDLYRRLIALDADHHDFLTTDAAAPAIVRQVESLGLLQRERAADDADGAAAGARDVLCHDPLTSVLMTWYRNNVLHVLAAPAFIACLLVNRRRALRQADLMRLYCDVFPFVRDELQASEPRQNDLPRAGGGGGEYSADGEDSVGRWVGHLCAVGLVERRGDGFGVPALPTARFRLRLLANTVMHVLERFYIVVALLSRHGSGNVTAPTLLDESRARARRVERLYGVNAPEFSDARLFGRFVDGLIESGVASVAADGALCFDERVAEILLAARGVISAELRQALEALS